MGARTESLLGHSRRDVRSQVSLGHGRPNPQTSAAAAHSILNVLAPIAQLVELRTFNPQVAGSSPAGGTKTGFDLGRCLTLARWRRRMMCRQVRENFVNGLLMPPGRDCLQWPAAT